ncbi:tubulin-folding cofactor B isoform X2 [Cucumis melo var. makuwa]|uniref:Tubulin-folding cofactor B isoform X2 n=1 Tax=Cucumis melo var. makuwa TaxID=1194695 RepID=A0A5A7VAQ4_CUCMM|nr:tubulin-folding cofactor B isoform X2 [Cucumis melo var. makuwa]TYK08826.1 tubulin-folding cofactor B isoform X2 [Cucumis melo var. makuwa]
MASRLQQIEKDESVLLRVTHANLKSFTSDVRFSLQMSVESVKEKLWRKCGTSVNSMCLELYDDSGSKISDLTDNSIPLGFYSPLDGYRLHIIDLDPSSVTSGGWLEDTSLVEKFQISEEAYDKRDDTFRKFKEKLASQNPSAFESKISDNYMEELCANIKEESITNALLQLLTQNNDVAKNEFPVKHFLHLIDVVPTDQDLWDWEVKFPLKHSEST